MRDRTTAWTAPWARTLFLATGLVLATIQVATAGKSSSGSRSVDIDEPTKPGSGPWERPWGDTDPPPPSSAILQDTIWIADWSFDPGCASPGWTVVDNRIRNDGSNYWAIATAFNGAGGIVNQAAILSKHDLCWAQDGYGNNWDYSIVLKYSGSTATLSFDFLSDSEPSNDFVTVEADSAGVSESLVNYGVDPSGTPASFRSVLFATSGDHSGGVTVSSLALPDFGAGIHEVYVRFESDVAHSDEDGLYPTVLGAGLVVDNIVVTGGTAYSENFEAVLNANVMLVNSSLATPFGSWARVFSHITDNNKCNENPSCAWLQTDPTRIAFFPNMAFGPGSAVIRNWLEESFVSPWVSLASTPSASGTVLSYRNFPGNRFGEGRIVQGWRVRAKVRVDNTDTSTLGDSIDCIGPWRNTQNFNLLGLFSWITSVYDLAPELDLGASEIQVRFHLSDWQWIAGASPPVTLNTGPGPFTDRIRIGRRVLSGPTLSEGLDARSQAQATFPTSQNAILPGEHFSPTTSRFGTCAFSMAADLGVNSPGSPNLITGDSIVVTVLDARGAGGITSVRWYGAVVAGPHAGKSPAPYTIGGNGFFEVLADSVRASNGSIVRGRFFVDLDDTYFRGGDVLQYFWTAADAGGGFASLPEGMTALPASVLAAEVATGGLHEADFLPAVNWDPTYLAAIAADTHGDIEPTPGQIANSSQRNCILYVNHYNPRRRSGSLHVTSFMRTLNALGYEGSYDVYDTKAFGNVNNALGSRSTIEQLTGYLLIVHDTGRLMEIAMPDGADADHEKVDQALFYRNWLANGLVSQAGYATLWLLGENVVYSKRANPLFTTEFGIASVVDDQGLAVSPDVEGIANHTFANGSLAAFVGDRFSLAGGCPGLRAYDGYTAGGTAVATHRYRTATVTGASAIVMNSSNILKWNTIAMGFGWFDIRDRFGGAPSTPAQQLAARILNAVLGPCVEPIDPTPGTELGLVPPASRLYANVPNPFNPVTAIRFDLARTGRVQLRVYDASGQLVRTLLDAALPARAGHQVLWNGLDAAGRRAASGVYFYQIVTDDFTATRKTVLLK